MVILCILLACLIKRQETRLETRRAQRGRKSPSNMTGRQHAERDTLLNVPVIYLLLKSGTEMTDSSMYARE